MKYLLLLLLSFNAQAIVFNGIILNAGVLNTDVCSSAVQINSFTGYSLQAVVTGATADGTMEIQASDDPYAPANISAWVTVASSAVVVSGPGVSFWNVSDAYYNFFRVCFSWGAGTGLATINYNVKEGK